jgi:hypothetical protein
MLDLFFDTVTVNDEKARKELGYRPIIDYETGIKEIQASLSQTRNAL